MRMKNYIEQKILGKKLKLVHFFEIDFYFTDVTSLPYYPQVKCLRCVISWNSQVEQQHIKQDIFRGITPKKIQLNEQFGIIY